MADHVPLASCDSPRRLADALECLVRTNADFRLTIPAGGDAEPTAIEARYDPVHEKWTVSGRDSDGFGTRASVDALGVCIIDRDPLDLSDEVGESVCIYGFDGSADRPPAIVDAPVWIEVPANAFLDLIFDSLSPEAAKEQSAEYLARLVGNHAAYREAVAEADKAYEAWRRDAFMIHEEQGWDAYDLDPEGMR